MTAVYRPDLPRRTAVWTCSACAAAACEMSGTEGLVPRFCPCGGCPGWRRSA